jgi:hypothetical protein
MSFMPSPGCIVKMLDGRVAIVSGASPLGDEDAVMFDDGHVEKTDAWQLEQMLTDEDLPAPSDCLAALRSFLADPRATSVGEFDEYAFVITLSNGGEIVVRWDAFPRLLHATDEQRRACEIICNGDGVHWENLNEDISIRGLLGLACK